MEELKQAAEGDDYASECLSYLEKRKQNLKVLLDLKESIVIYIGRREESSTVSFFAIQDELYSLYTQVSFFWFNLYQRKLPK